MLTSGSQPSAAVADVPASHQPGGVWWVALGLTLAIFGLLLGNDRVYFFHTKMHEVSDWASNSLFVREAKHTFLLHGHYSRWGFYHPGPVLLDTLAVGETLFYDHWHLVPTPFNGQIIMLGVTLTAFFSVALSLFARQLGPRRGGVLFFLPLALCLAVWHYGAARGGQVFLSSWPAFPPVIVFLCLLVATAAAGAGSGWALPVLVVAGGWLVHNHVAQPLFVVPLTLLAYGGLLVSCWRLPRPATSARPGLGDRVTAGWRAFPKAHGIAVGLLALFVLPLAVDAAHGGDSNLARILAHLHDSHEPLKKLPRSLCYFLTFGTYEFYQPGRDDFGRYSAAGMLAFAELHWRVYALWLGALLGAPALFFASRRRWRAQEPPGETSGQDGFVAWFYVVLAAAVGLTLAWGMKQDGPMYYYNSLFNYSIYFGVALGFAAALASALMAWTDSARLRRARPAVAVLLWLGLAGSVWHQAELFHARENFSTPNLQALAVTVDREAASLPQNAVCFIDWHPRESWPTALAVGLELERQGRSFVVSEDWGFMFGARHVLRHENLDSAVPLARWSVVPRGETPDQLPLLAGNALRINPPTGIDPAGQSIRFAKNGNFQDYALSGWSPTDSTWTWSVERAALLEFRPLPLPANAGGGVDLWISAWAFTPPGKPVRQQVELRFNGLPLGSVYLSANRLGRQPLCVRIDAALWEAGVAQGTAQLEFRFPDAVTPASAGMGADTRPLGGAFASLTFQPAGSTPPANAPP